MQCREIKEKISNRRNMKRLLSFVLSGVIGLCGVMAHAQSPFEVSPRVVELNGSRTLHIAFIIPTNHVLYAEKIAVKLDDIGDQVAAALPQPVSVQDKFSGKQKLVFKQSFEAVFPLAANTTNLAVHFQGCDEANCYFPEDRTFSIAANGVVARMDDSNEETSPAVASVNNWQEAVAGMTVVNRGSGYMNEKEFLGFLDKSQSGDGASEVGTTRTGFWGVLLTMGIILLGGVALNLTPCILPMIPINLAIIGAGAQAGSKKRGFALGATYAAGMAIAYGVLGLFVVLTGSKFGTLNSSPWFNLAIASVFLFLALAMFDVVNVDLSRFQKTPSGGSSGSSKSKFIVAYTMGTVAALLAGACVAPVVISVLLQATTLHAKGITVGLLLPFLLGLGMGLPWPFAGAGLSFLPKPGKWMVRVKYGFGVMIVLFGAYYGHLAYGLFRSSSDINAQARTGGESTAGANFSDDLVKAMSESKKDGLPVFIDFYASWCKNCSAMEHSTFAAEAVKNKLAGYHEVRFQAEHPNESPAKEVLDHFKVMGLPSFVVLAPESRQIASVKQ